MRRNDREITDRSGIDAIIRECRVCRLGFCDRGEAYVVPLNFGYDGESLYFHTAAVGRKMEILSRNDRVAFEFDIPGEMVEAEEACGWTLKYRSVMGSGRAGIVEDPEIVQRGYAALMAQYTDIEFEIPEKQMAQARIIRLRIERISGKQSL